MVRGLGFRVYLPFKGLKPKPHTASGGRLQCSGCGNNRRKDHSGFVKFRVSGLGHPPLNPQPGPLTRIKPESQSLELGMFPFAQTVLNRDYHRGG